MTKTLLFALLFATSVTTAADLPSTAAALVAANADASTIAGNRPSWFFLSKELQHLSHGDLSSTDLATANTHGTDPIPAIQQYIEELAALGVEVWLVPVPAKAAIYPDSLSADLAIPNTTPLAPFLTKLAATGARMIDLSAVYLEHRKSHPDQQLYCATDSHWSPLGAQIAATTVAQALAPHPALAAIKPTSFTVASPEDLAFHGDLLTDAQKTSLPAETLPMRRVNPGTEGTSPILVIGDSHCQVFRKGGTMLATNAGFIDHLAAYLSLPIEDISNQASGADQPRADIARRTAKEPGFWASRPILIWVFTEREFTQGRWRPIPAQVLKK